MSGVGISFGADRIEDVLEHFEKFPDFLNKSTDVLIANMGDDQLAEELKLASDLRALDYAVEIYPDATKLKKQMKYADDKSIPFVVIMGEDERPGGKATLKNMTTGDQTLLSIAEISSNLAK